ncbi:MAG TPA: serine protease, partial [Gemmataceae bacterium]|nr:serine protease [Gemmataceae bacterium]
MEKKSALPLVLVSAVVCMGLLLVLCGALITYLVMSGNSTEVAKTSAPPAPQPPVAPQPPLNPPAVPPAGRPPAIQPAPHADNQPVQPQPVQSAKPVAATAAGSPPDARAQGELKKEDKEENIGRLTEERRMHVRRATVYIRVKMPDGSMASGSGFFGCKDAHNIVLTNAHVVGMLSPESMRPQSVDVIVNSGESGEWKTSARILGVDRESDLALLDIGTPSQTVPEPLTVKSAGGLRELDDLYVCGFPLGEGLGKEISMRRASVSAMRRKNGVLKHVQVEGGMTHGNSGGPVVDKSGAVVGVAVGGIEGEQINFAIPGERVHAILNGRLSDLTVGQSYFLNDNDNKVAVPVAMDMIDPRNLIKEVGLEVWTGDKPADDKSGIRPAATAQPARQAGDSQHNYYKLRYSAPEGRDPIVLPEWPPPPGKVYWKQPCWIDATGQKHWAAADAMTTLYPPVHRTPANLVLRYTQGATRTLDLNFDNIFKVSSSQESDPFHIRTVAQLTEKVASTGSSGTLLRLRYKYAPSWDLLLPDGRNIPNGKLEEVKSDLKRLITSVMQLDRLGNITQQAIEPNPLLRQLALTKPKQAEAAKEFHEMIQQGLGALSVPLPGSGSVRPLESWRAERPLPIDTPTPGRTETAKLDVHFTYLGTRKRDGR